MSSPKLTHLDADGRAAMVDVGAKPDTERVAVATGLIRMAPATLALVVAGGLPKGDVLAVARIAGIQAAKRTSDLVPLCHPLPLTHVAVDLAPDRDAPGLRATATVRTRGKTGVEMEALAAVSVALLTVYDMAKAVERGMEITGVGLVEKRGGTGGDWRRAEAPTG
ncbi:cyclic pyranopterin monophosphate synthase MoaC [bacterium]|nr:cyclic pyranopterin monophosphate synthase MoaC [Chloroflexi bacterium CFX6]RIL05625.1 MAG: cyclic pyranopterin monophosphate synthase MoaC [bacterium]